MDKITEYMKPIKSFFVNLLLLFASVLLVKWLVVSWFGLGLLVLTLVKISWKHGFVTALVDIGKFFRTIAMSIDASGGVILQVPLNFLFVKKGGYPYGRVGEMISSATGKNVKLGTLTFLGVFFDKFLNLFEKNHSINSVQDFK